MADPGWYADPLGHAEYRYFDGEHWTDQVSTGGNIGTDPPVEAAPLTPAEDHPPPPGPETAAETRSVWWFVAAGAVLVALVAVAVVFLAGGNDDESAAPDDTESTTTTTEATTTTTTEAPTTTTDAPTTTTAPEPSSDLPPEEAFIAEVRAGEIAVPAAVTDEELLTSGYSACEINPETQEGLVVPDSWRQAFDVVDLFSFLVDLQEAADRYLC